MRNWKRLVGMKPKDLRRMQDAKLRAFVRRQLYPFSPHYRELFDREGIDPRSIRTRDDLRRIPFSSKADLAPEDNPKAFQDFILQPDSQSVRAGWGLARVAWRAGNEWLRGRSLRDGLDAEYRPIFLTATTGRSARQVPFLYSAYDIDRMREAGRRLVDVSALTREDRVVNIFPFAPHLAFWQVAQAGLAAGIFGIGTGGGKVSGTAKNIKTIANLKATSITGVPGYVYHLLREAVEREADFSAVRQIVLGAEKVTDEQKARMRGLLERMGARDVQILGTYGLTEARMAWIECPAEDHASTGYHLYPDMGLFEVIDPDSGEPVGEGETGELVYTPLDGRGSLVFRYRTGDIAHGGIARSPCPACGRTVPRVSTHITRRVQIEDLRLSKIKGTLVNLDDFTHTLARCHAAEEWQVEVRKRNDDPHDLDEIVVYVAPRRGFTGEEATRSVETLMRESLEVAPNRVVVESLPRLIERLGMETEPKEKRVIDRRPELRTDVRRHAAAARGRPRRRTDRLTKGSV